MPDSRERVLLVDDDPGFREAYRELLVQDGYAVHEAATAPAAPPRRVPPWKRPPRALIHPSPGAPRSAMPLRPPGSRWSRTPNG